MSKTKRQPTQDLLHYLARCPICFEDYSFQRAPVTLKCGHNFCIECIIELRRGRASVLCPLDKKQLRARRISLNLELLKVMQVARSAIRPSEQVDEDTNCSEREIQAELEEEETKLEKEVTELQEFVDKLHLWFPAELYYHIVFTKIQQDFNAVSQGYL